MSNFLKQLGESAKSGITALPAGLISSAGSGFLGGLIGNLFAKKRAKLELKNQKALMDFQADKQLELTRNQALANKEGLRAAGFSTAMIDGPFSLAAAPGGGASMPSANTNLDIARDYNALQSAGLSASQTQGQLISNQYSSNIFERQLGEMDERIANIAKDTDNKSADILLKEENLKRMRATYETFVNECKLKVDNLEKTLEKLGFETQIAEIQAKYADDEMYFRLNSMATQISVMVSQRKLNEADAKKAFANIALANAQTAQYRLENELFRDTYDAKVKEIKANSRAACYAAADAFYSKEEKKFVWEWKKGKDVPERVNAEMQALLDEMLLKPKLMEEEITYFAARTGLTRAQVKTEHAKMIENYTRAAKNVTGSVKDLTGAAGDLVGAAGKLITMGALQ